jgi:hypothetical protein
MSLEDFMRIERDKLSKDIDVILTKYEQRVTDEVNRRVGGGGTRGLSGSLSSGNFKLPQVVPPSVIKTAAAAEAPKDDRSKTLKKLIRKDVKDVKDCFLCATTSVECRSRKSKIKDNVTFTILKKGYLDTADQVYNTGIIPIELHPYWLCGNHKGKNVAIDMEKLASHYMQFCELMDIPLDDRVFEKLKKAGDTSSKRLKRSAAGDDDDDDDVDDDNVNGVIEPMIHDDEEEDEDYNNHHDELEEDVAPDRADPEDMLQVFDFLKPANLMQRKDIKEYKEIHTTSCPINNLQIFQFNDQTKICLGVSTEYAPEDMPETPDIYIGFYSKKYTDTHDATPMHANTRWVPCVAELFVEAGETEIRAKKGVEHFVRLAKRMLDVKHRNN